MNGKTLDHSLGEKNELLPPPYRKINKRKSSANGNSVSSESGNHLNEIVCAKKLYRKNMWLLRWSLIYLLFFFKYKLFSNLQFMLTQQSITFQLNITSNFFANQSSQKKENKKIKIPSILPWDLWGTIEKR